MIERLDLIGRAAALEVQDAFKRVGKRARRIWRDPAKRDRVKAHLAFVLIFGFVVSSVDYLITGGPDWNPTGEAYAMEMPGPRNYAAPTRAEPTNLAATTEEQAALIEEIDYSFTAETLLGGPETVLANSAPITFEGKPGAENAQQAIVPSKAG